MESSYTANNVINSEFLLRAMVAAPNLMSPAPDSNLYYIKSIAVVVNRIIFLLSELPYTLSYMTDEALANMAINHLEGKENSNCGLIDERVKKIAEDLQIRNQNSSLASDIDKAIITFSKNHELLKNPQELLTELNKAKEKIKLLEESKLNIGESEEIDDVDPDINDTTTKTEIIPINNNSKDDFSDPFIDMSKEYLDTPIEESLNTSTETLTSSFLDQIEETNLKKPSIEQDVKQDVVKEKDDDQSSQMSDIIKNKLFKRRKNLRESTVSTNYANDTDINDLGDDDTTNKKPLQNQAKPNSIQKNEKTINTKSKESVIVEPKDKKNNLLLNYSQNKTIEKGDEKKDDNNSTNNSPTTPPPVLKGKGKKYKKKHGSRINIGQ